MVVKAKTVFLTNAEGSNFAYDAFYSKMKEWGKYEIVGSPNEADLIIELAYKVDKSTGVGSSPIYSPNKENSGIVQTGTRVSSYQILDPQLVLTIYDAKTRTSLWSETDHRRLARRQKNREKETVNSAQRLVDDLRARASVQE